MKNKQITLAALFLSLCVIVPFLFHMVGSGEIWLPMFLPILMAGFVIEFPTAILVGILGPFISALVTGMPPLFPTSVMMSIEGAVTVGLASYLYFEKKMAFWHCLSLAIIAERTVRIFMLAVFLPLLGLPVKAFTVADFTIALPGVALQFIVIPIFYYSFKKFKLME